MLFKDTNSAIVSFDFLGVERTLFFDFTEDDNIPKYNFQWKLNYEGDKNKVHMILNKWRSDTFVENTEPFELVDSTAPKTYLAIKCRISRREDLNGFFQFDISAYTYVI